MVWAVGVREEAWAAVCARSVCACARSGKRPMEGENPGRREDEVERRRRRRAGGECVGVGSSRGEIPGSWAGLGDWQRLFLGSPSAVVLPEVGEDQRAERGAVGGGVGRCEKAGVMGQVMGDQGLGLALERCNPWQAPGQDLLLSCGWRWWGLGLAVSIAALDVAWNGTSLLLPSPQFDPRFGDHWAQLWDCGDP